VAEQAGNNDGDTFDYVIVGSGAAGSVLCRRLTEDPGVTVCVLECGPPDRHPFIHIPAGFIKMLFNPAYTWQFQTEPGEGIDGRRIPTTQGRTLGGSSSINGMIYNRGQRADFDQWAQRGNRGWGYVDVLPYFKRTEQRIGVADDRIHGRAGALPVTDMDWFHPVCDAFMDGAQELGIPRCDDYNSGDAQAGVGYFQRLINRGYRHSAARVFLHPARRGGQLDVRTDARASQILFDGKRATSVRYIDDRDRVTTRTVHARSTDPFEDPAIQPNYLKDPIDRRVLLNGMKLARKLLHTDALAPYFDGDELPGPATSSDDEWMDYARQYGSTAYHLIGTARMGPATDKTSVVSDQLLVHGLENLRVVDASVMPSMPSANTYSSTMMIAEKASDMIRGRQPLAPVEGIAA
jgi:choline dehydrogenase-like flavoprotein